MSNNALLTPNWADAYELIDSGNGEKLERFADFILRRPEPQALWAKSLTEQQWNDLAHYTFQRSKNGDGDKGEWLSKPSLQKDPRWWITFQLADTSLKMRLGLTSFKHVGLFPEQKSNWEWTYNQIKAKPNQSKVLNLFAYTGGASIAAAVAGAEVSHVEAVKQMVNWAAENSSTNNLSNCRWYIDDAVKFVKREVRRQHLYDGIILDPPAYGRGPDGEKWILSDSILDLLQSCKHLLKPDGFIVLSLYSMGFSAFVGENLLRDCFNLPNIERAELGFKDRTGRSLPMGVVIRANA